MVVGGGVPGACGSLITLLGQYFSEYWDVEVKGTQDVALLAVVLAAVFSLSLCSFWHIYAIHGNPDAQRGRLLPADLPYRHMRDVRLGRPSVVTRRRPSPSVVTRRRPWPSVVTRRRPWPSVVTKA